MNQRNIYACSRPPPRARAARLFDPRRDAVGTNRRRTGRASPPAGNTPRRHRRPASAEKVGPGTSH